MIVNTSFPMSFDENWFVILLVMWCPLYLLRSFLIQTLWIGRNSSRRSVLNVSTRSYPKSNNSLAWDKSNSHF